MQSPMPGTLHLIAADPNPNGIEGSRLFLFKGDPVSAPVKHIIPEEGVLLPGPKAGSEAEPFTLKVLHFNDLHGQISLLSRPCNNQPVFSRMVWKIKQLRSR
ncbi:MAG: bifunctional metallophosphatase/5'-nucleotidase, partial [Spirochaetota bacterium]